MDTIMRQGVRRHMLQKKKLKKNKLKLVSSLPSFLESSPTIS